MATSLSFMENAAGTAPRHSSHGHNINAENGNTPLICTVRFIDWKDTLAPGTASVTGQCMVDLAFLMSS